MDEVVKVLVGLLAAAVLGYPLSAVWAARQKRKELSIIAANELYSLYGEFFALWKLWNYVCPISDPSSSNETYWRLLERASLAEGRMESLIVRVATERRLTPEALESLGKFRQAYQTLRQSIKRNVQVPWHFAEHPEYLAFKQLTAEVANITVRERWLIFQRTPSSASQLIAITSNARERDWAVMPSGSNNG